MNWLYKLEAKYGKYAIQNLPLYIVILYAIGVVIDLMTGGMAEYMLGLNPYLIIEQHEFWRIITFVITPPSTSIWFVIFVLFFYYSIGQSLVNVWGAFKFNMYVLVGVLGTILSAFLVYFVLGKPAGIYMDTYYLNLSMFLAYAAIFPEMSVYLYGILPIKVKWLGYLDVALLVYSFIVGGVGSRIAIVVSMLNFLLFFFSTRNYKKVSPTQIRRKQKYKKDVHNSTVGARHKCAICGRTEKDNPNLEFRFCSKCEGNYEYCQDHLYTHTHVK